MGGEEQKECSTINSSDFFLVKNAEANEKMWGALRAKISLDSILPPYPMGYV